LHALSHVTGGGLASNLARVLPTGLVAEVDRSTWQVPPIFDLIRSAGRTTWPELETTLNLGVGMVAAMAPDAVDAALRALADAGIPAWELGRVVPDSGQDAVRGTKGVHGGGVRLSGQYRTA
jgi:phosphoribosylformylglycinamidine cyclo-ligase